MIHSSDNFFLDKFAGRGFFLKKSVSVFFLLAIQVCIIHGMEGTIPLRLCYSDGTFKEQIWTQTDFNKITLLRMTAQFKDSYSLTIREDLSYVTHNYLKDLINGRCTAQNIGQYIEDYDLLIGNDIALDKNGKYGPFKKSLKWQVFQKHKNFFYENIDCNNFVRDFLYCDISKESPFEKENIILTKIGIIGLKGFTDEAIKLSICYPYIMHYQHIFEKNENVMFLEFDNCIIENLELKTLFEYFPNLHTLSIKNCYLKAITNDDYYALLTQLKPKDQWFVSKEILRSLGRSENEKIDGKDLGIMIATQKDTDSTRKYFALRHHHYSFLIDLEGTKIVNADDLITDHAPTTHVSSDKKPIVIKNFSNKKLIYQRLKFFAKNITLFVLASILNVFFISKLLSFYKNQRSGLLPVLPFLWIIVSGIVMPVFALAFYEEIRSKSIVIQ